MDVFRRVDAYCDRCREVRTHIIPEHDHGLCRCTVCGHEDEVFDPASMGIEEPVARGVEENPVRNLDSVAEQARAERAGKVGLRAAKPDPQMP